MMAVEGGRSPRVASRVLAWMCRSPVGVEDKEPM